MINQGKWPKIVLKGLSTVFLDEYRDFQSMLPYMYRFKDAEQAVETDLETGGLGLPSAYNGEIYYDDISEGYSKSVSEQEYTYGLKISRKLLRNDLYGAIEDKVGDLAIGFREIRETMGAYPFNNAFGSFTVGDGNPLCYSAHTSKNGGSNQGNAGSSALSAANVAATRLLMKKFKTNVDRPTVNKPDVLIIPMDLEETAYEILESMGKVDHSTNNKNFLQGRFDVIIWDNFLTSTSNWFMANKKMMKKHLIFREWEKTQFFRDGEFDTLVTKCAGYTSFGVSAVDWRWVYGHEV